MTANSLLPDNTDHEPLEEGGTWLLDLAAAVDHLRRGVRPGLTVWDAIDEALRAGEPDWDDPDPLRSTLTALLDRTAGSVEVEIQAAVRRWVVAAAHRYNNGHHWPHPATRRGFPPPAVDLASLSD
ncbi:MAG: hypothetical protein ACOYXM_03860 [Actinomycetota bacterium]